MVKAEAHGKAFDSSGILGGISVVNGNLHSSVETPPNEPQQDATTTIQPSCPKCGSRKVWRDAKRFTKLGDEIQRWYCRECGRRFSDPEDVAKARSTFERIERIESKSLKTSDDIVTSSQICVKETKNLAAEPPRNRFLRRNETLQLQA